MAKNEYEWQIGSPPPTIKLHSLVKHEIIHAYIAKYVSILAANPAQRQLRLTLVDGFAGGGLYLREDNSEQHEGSPLVLIKACREAEFLANNSRANGFQLSVDYFFVEKKQQNFLYLEALLKDRGFGKDLGQTIHLLKDDIKQQVSKITNFIEKKGRARRAIFFLDQYGYDQVPRSLIREILERLPNAEIIFTFNVDALITFLSDNPKSRRLLNKIGLSRSLEGISLASLKLTDKAWRRAIQTYLLRELVEACGAKHFTPFFIRPGQGFGNYWLIHLSMHPRARSAMIDIHWESQNRFIHFGGAGLNMLGYTPKDDPVVTGQEPLDFLFDESSKERSSDALHEDLARFLGNHPDGLSFAQLVSDTCNTTPASDAIYKEALGGLMRSKVIHVVGASGERRREGTSISLDDRISLVPQRLLFLFGD